MSLLFSPTPEQPYSQTPQCFPSSDTSVLGWISKAHHFVLLSESVFVHLSYDTPLYLKGNTHSWLPAFELTFENWSWRFLVLQGAIDVTFNTHFSHEISAKMSSDHYRYIFIVSKYFKTLNDVPAPIPQPQQLFSGELWSGPCSAEKSLFIMPFSQYIFL